MAKKRSISTTPGSAGAAEVSAEAQARVRELIGASRLREAVDAAKELVKSLPGPVSERLLVDAYAARVRQLQAEGLQREALALCDVAVSRVPSARAELDAIREEVSLLSDGFRGLLQTLGSADEGERARLSALLARRLTDPGVLADSPHLPDDHPLRQQARAVRDAFVAVTSGPVSDEALRSLEVVPRSSPLAGWKLLVRAIHALYRGDADSVRRNVSAIPPESAVASLGPALLALLSPEAAPGPLSPSAASLVGRLGDPLAAAVRDLDAAVEADDEPKAVRAAVRVRDALPKGRPWLLTAFHRTVVSAFVQRQFSPEAVFRDVFTARWRTEGRRFLALELEKYDWETSLLAWDEHLKARAYETPLPTDAERAAILLRMAGLFPPDEQDFLEDLELPSRQALLDEIRVGLIPACLDQGALLGKALAARRSSATFRARLRFLVPRDPAEATAVARDWHGAFPADPEPLLYLIDQAESRKRWKDALSLLEQAEAQKHLSPEIRGRRFLLRLGEAEDLLLRGQGAAAREVVALARQESTAKETDVAGYLAMLEWAAYLCGKKPDPGAERAAETIREVAKSRAFADVLFESGLRFPLKQPVPGIVEPSEGADSFSALVRTSRLLRRLGRPLSVPTVVVAAAEKHLQLASFEELKDVCFGSAPSAWPRLVYAATTRGLGGPGPLVPYFLAARARALAAQQGPFVSQRIVDCLLAARHLAQKSRDSEALEAVSIAVLRFESVFGHACELHGHGEDPPPGDAEVEEILRHERKILDLVTERARVPKPAKMPRRAKRPRVEATPSLFGDDE